MELSIEYIYDIDCSNGTDSGTDSDTGCSPEIHPIRVAVPVFIAVFSVVGLVGNVCMMYAILRYSHMRTVPNVLIFNLAMADLLYILVTTPIYVKHELEPAFHLSAPACKLKNYVAFVAQHASVFALAALSRERHSAIVGGMEARRGGDSCASGSRVTVAVMWLVAFIVCIPTLVFAHVIGEQCKYSPSDRSLARVYECLHFLVGYTIPLIIVGFYYTKIAMSLFHSTHSFQNDYVSDAMAQQIRVRKRLAVSVLVIAIFFAVCWFPYFFYYLWINFAPQDEFMLVPFPSAADVLRYIGLVAPVINTCMDPWLLFVISSRHRACLVRCLCGGCFCCSREGALEKRDGQGMSMTTMSRSHTGKSRMFPGAGTSFSRLSRV
ncbi:bombesin receptor subtype-3-like [Patiria miniata]|uniref:G-protein coupled receptors family 1 profile domain-containing protein n=1 Tax=Patiria miniata TaxID=46514 RepID=A0A913ZM76_PATMI|nr:bombesin receptor subtype-3-like [Patiria miniata]